jgi:hypothetical protein
MGGGANRPPRSRLHLVKPAPGKAANPWGASPASPGR